MVSRTHPWRNPIVHLDTWAAGDEAGSPYLEQHTVNLEPQRVTPLFVTGDSEWRDYRVEVSVRPLSLQQEAGLVFRYRTSRHYYRLALEDGARLRLVVRLPIDQEFRVAAWRELASVPFPYDTKTWYRFEVSTVGDRLRASVDGKLLADVQDRRAPSGNRRHHGEHAGAVQVFPRHNQSSVCRRPSWPQRAPRRPISIAAARGQPEACSCGRSSTRPASALAATSASAISTATAASTCCSRRTSPKFAATPSITSVA